MALQYMLPGVGFVEDQAASGEYMLPGVGFLEETNAAVAMLTADRTSGMAELSVQFSVNRGITAGDALPIREGSEIVDRVLYVWDFGDANDFVNGENLRYGFGPNVSHLYKTAGTFVCTMYAFEAGVETTWTQTITVSAWSGGTTYYVNSELGSDANAGTAAGASAWATATQVHTHLQALGASTQAQYLFTAVTAAGAQMQFTHNINATIGTRTEKVRIGVHDPGTTGIKPKINCGSPNGWLHMTNACDDIRIVGLHVAGLSSSGSWGVRPGKHTTIYNCLFDGFDIGLNTGALHLLKEYVLLQQCRYINTRGYCSLFNFGRYCAFISNTFDGIAPFATGGLGGAHVLRTYMTRSYFAFNELTGSNGQQGHIWKWVGIAPVGSASRPSQVDSDIPYIEYTTTWRNKLHSARPTGTAILFSISPIDSGDDQLAQHCMFWENRVAMNGSAAQIGYDIQWPNNSYVNNVADLTGSTSATRKGFRVRRRGIELNPDTNNLLHNTTYCGSGSGSVWGIHILNLLEGGGTPAAPPTSNVVKNNLLLSTAGTAQGSNGVSDEGTTTTLTTNKASTTATDLVLPGGIEGDYRPTSGSSAADFCTRLDAAYYASTAIPTRTARPSAALASDAGAYEFVSVVSVVAEPEPVVSSMGVNLDKCKYNSTALIFKDLMKQSGAATGNYAAYGWQTINSSTLADTADTVTDYIGATGWPDVTLPTGTRTIETYMRSYLTGSHTVLFDGAGTLIFRGAAVGTITASGQTITVDTANTDIKMRVSATDVGTPINNIRVVPDAYVATYVAAPFYPDLITRLQTFALAGTRAVIRAMELTRTNGYKPVTGWANRSLTTWNSQATGFGMAWETVCDLANEVGADLWVCIPHQYADADITSLAALLLTDLGTNLRVFVEFSNEVWNTSFDAYSHAATGTGAVEMGNAAGFSGTDSQKAKKWYAKRSAEMFDLFKTAWGQSSFRLVKVLGTQASQTTVTDTILDYFEETTIDAVNVNPNGTKVNAVAIAPYFGAHTTTGDRFGEDIGANTGDSTYLTATDDALLTRIQDNYMPLAVSFMQAQKNALAIWAAISSKPYTGAQLICYEGGASITSENATDQANAALTARLSSLRTLPGFYDLVLYYLDQWENIGGTLFCWFHFCDAWVGADMFGAMQSLNPSPSEQTYNAIVDFNAGVRPAPGGGGTPGGALPEPATKKPYSRYFGRHFKTYNRSV